MKKTNSILIAIFATTVFFANAQPKTTQLKQSNDLKIENMDTTAILGNNFYRYATGGWTDSHPIPDAYPYYTTFMMLRDLSTQRVQDIIEELSNTKNDVGSDAQKIGDLYRQGMDSVKLNTEKAAPIQQQLTQINAANTIDDVIKLSGSLVQYPYSPFLYFSIDADDMNSSMNIANINQGGLGLKDRDYYLATDEKSKKLRDGYVNLINEQFQNAGYTKTEAKAAAEAVMRIETALAKSHFEKEKTRIPELNYHNLNVDQLNDSIANFDWNLYFSSIGATDIKNLNVGQIQPISNAIELIKNTPIKDSKAYLSWCIINSSANYLSDDFVNANFDFYGKQLNGTKIIQPRWKRTITTINNTLGEEVGKIYVTKYFPDESKKRMLALVEDLRIALKDRINGLDWMSEETKTKALEKLDSVKVKIGYPDKWQDRSTLSVNGNSYWQDVVMINKFDFDKMLSKVDKPVDKSEWTTLPQTVNAFYNPLRNDICFPAAILQEPFFYANGDDAINYGAIGMVIGHELSHGFDDQGSKYDKNGNMIDWWTAEDAKKFKNRTQVLVDFFDSIVVVDSLHANGSFTLGENIGDNGGLQIAYTAFLKTEEGKSKEKIDGFLPLQRFFLAYANLWASNIRDEFAIYLTKIDTHSLGKWRVDGALRHINAWYDAFDITPKDSLYLAPEKRASIW